jgi:RNA polymerase sigma-70 factor (ECF subfamily)
VIRLFRFASSGARGDSQRQKGDGEFLLQHLNAAYNLARWLVSDENDAEDVIHTAYLRASNHFEGFRRGDGRAWLLSIVRNSCYDHLSQKKPAANPQTASPLKENTNPVTKSLAELTAEHREVLVLRELEQLSYREIAKIIGIPLNMAISRLSRARQQFCQSLSDYMEPMRVDLNDPGSPTAINA